MLLFFDGGGLDRSLHSFPTRRSSDLAVIGWTDATWMAKFPGSLDEVAMCTAELSAAVAAVHCMASGPALKGQSTYQPSVAADNPVADWRLGEASGTATAADGSGQDHP